MFGEEKKEVYAAEFLYRELGHFQLQRQQYRRCYPAFDKAMELTPTDLRALLGRSFARAKTTYYTCAIDDTDKALKAQPGDLRAVQLKSWYKFLRTDFEGAMVMNERGSHLRKQPDSFIIGAMQCAEETERTIGVRGGHALRDHYDIIRTIAWKKAIDLRRGKIWKPRFKKRKRKRKLTDNTPALYTQYLAKIKQEQEMDRHPSDLSILESLTDTNQNVYNIEKKKKSSHRPPQPRTSNIDKLMAEKYLGKMCYDRWCLWDLKNDPRIESPNVAGTTALRTLARKGHRNVRYRQEILRVRLPYYAIKYNDIKPTGQFLKRQNAELEKTREVARHDTETLIKQLRAAREAYLTNTAIEIAYKIKTYIDKKSLKIMPNKESYLRQLYELIGLVFLDMYRLKDREDWDPTQRINFLFGLPMRPVERDESEDSVIKQNKKEFMSLKQAIKRELVAAEIRLAKASTPLETVWVYYDLARFSLDLNKYDFSRFYARKALNMAKILNNNVWSVVIHMLILGSHVQERNKNEAKTELWKTLEYAKRLKHEEIIAYIQKCIGVVEHIDFDDMNIAKVIKERETQIQDALIDRDSKNEIHVLFMRMAAIPASRRMSIMPGVRFEEDIYSPKKTASKASIIPKSEAELEFQRNLPPKKGMELLHID